MANQKGLVGRVDPGGKKAESVTKFSIFVLDPFPLSKLVEILLRGEGYGTGASGARYIYCFVDKGIL